MSNSEIILLSILLIGLTYMNWSTITNELFSTPSSTIEKTKHQAQQQKADIEVIQ